MKKKMIKDLELLNKIGNYIESIIDTLYKTMMCNYVCNQYLYICV